MSGRRNVSYVAIYDDEILCEALSAFKLGKLIRKHGYNYCDVGLAIISDVDADDRRHVMDGWECDDGEGNVDLVLK